MASTRPSFLAFLLAVALTFPISGAAFETPLSDTAVREAYFMGQRHDVSAANFFGQYYKHLPAPKSGPYISSVEFLTPYALLAQLSGERAYGYSAQQAEIDHRNMVETVKIVIRIQLTDTFGAVMPNPDGLTSGTPWPFIFRPTDFWRDFQIQVVSGKKVVSPFIYRGGPDYICGDGGCTLVGATVHLEFLADVFDSDCASIRVTPPEGDDVTVDFDLAALR